MFVTEDFQAYLSKPLEKGDIYIALSKEAYADLLNLLAGAGAFTYLTLRDDTHMETVKAWAEGGYVLLERGASGTVPHKFPLGTCVSAVSPTIVAAALAVVNGDEDIFEKVEKMIDDASCCDGGEIL